MTELKTDQALLDAMKSVSGRQLSAEERNSQRISFVMASLSEHNDMTREQVRKLIEHKQGLSTGR